MVYLLDFANYPLAGLQVFPSFRDNPLLKLAVQFSILRTNRLLVQLLDGDELMFPFLSLKIKTKEILHVNGQVDVIHL